MGKNHFPKKVTFEERTVKDETWAKLWLFWKACWQNEK
jgi:hypothetical protein